MSTTQPTASFEATTATFGARLKAARKAKGLTPAAMAEKLGVDLPTIDDWETDARAPRANSIQMMAGLLNVSIMWLITGDSNGTDHVEQTHARPEGINDALGEIAQLKETLAAALDKLENLQTRLQQID